MCTINRNATFVVVLLTALLASAALAIVPIIGIDGLFTIFNDKGVAVGTVTVDGTYEDTYAMDMAYGALPVPAGNGEVELTFSLSVADPAIDRRGEQWGVEFFRLDEAGKYIPIERSSDGRYRCRISLRGVRPGLVRVPVFYRFRASRSYSGFRLLGVKVTTDAKTGAGAGASSICLYVVQPPEGLNIGGQLDHDAVFAWAKSLHNIVVGGDERVAVGGIYPLFTPRSTSLPDPAVQAFVQQRLDAIKAQAKTDIDAAAKSAGEAAANELKTQYDGQISDLTQKLGQAQGDAQAAQAALAAANGILAQIRADAEHRTAAQAERLDVPKPAEPVEERPAAQAPWTARYEGGKLFVTACQDNVLVRINFGNRYKPVPETTLCKGKWVQIGITASTRVEVSVPVDGGQLTRIYGPDGPIN